MQHNFIYNTVSNFNTDFRSSHHGTTALQLVILGVYQLQDSKTTMSAKTIIVTGASRGKHHTTQSHAPTPTSNWTRNNNANILHEYILGIGLSITKYLLTVPQAHNVVVVARSVEPLRKLKEQYGRQVEVLNGDLADFSLASKAVRLATDTYGRLDGMVLNHGVLGQVGKVEEADFEQWKQGFDINFISLVAFVKAGLPALRESRGKIIFTSSGAAISAYRGWGLYGASKAAMNHLALTLGEEQPDVTSVSIRPGMVDTEMQRELREDHATTLEPQVHSKFTAVHKDGKLLKPEQPGHVMAKLVLDAPSTLTGKFLSWVLRLYWQESKTNDNQVERQGTWSLPGIDVIRHYCEIYMSSFYLYSIISIQPKRMISINQQCFENIISRKMKSIYILEALDAAHLHT